MRLPDRDPAIPANKKHHVHFVRPGGLSWRRVARRERRNRGGQAGGGAVLGWRVWLGSEMNARAESDRSAGRGVGAHAGSVRRVPAFWQVRSEPARQAAAGIPRRLGDDLGVRRPRRGRVGRRDSFRRAAHRLTPRWHPLRVPPALMSLPARVGLRDLRAALRRRKPIIASLGEQSIAVASPDFAHLAARGRKVA
jgi:hypothetical protein